MYVLYIKNSEGIRYIEEDRMMMRRRKGRMVRMMMMIKVGLMKKRKVNKEISLNKYTRNKHL